MNSQITCTLATPEQVQVKDGAFFVGKGKYHAIYRHIFAERLANFPKLLDALQNQTPILNPVATLQNQTPILNPVAVHYEVKSLFALVYLLSRHPEIISYLKIPHFSPELILKYIPPTFLLRSKVMIGPHSIDQTPLIARWIAHPKDYILKKNRSYGGKAVIFGTSQTPSEWAQLIQQKLQTPKELWIVQSKISAPTAPICRSDGQNFFEEADFFDMNLFLDCINQTPRLVGPSSRFSKNPIVNLGLGGGMLPTFVSKY